MDSAVLFDRYILEVKGWLRGDGSAGLANSALIERNDETRPSWHEETGPAARSNWRGTAITAPPNLAEAGPWLARQARTRFSAHRHNYDEPPACTFFRARRLEGRPALKVLGDKTVSKRFQICQVRLQHSGDFFAHTRERRDSQASRFPKACRTHPLPAAAETGTACTEISSIIAGPPFGPGENKRLHHPHGNHPHKVSLTLALWRFSQCGG